jgi:colanic acid/amylovoran biosynthesis glycosyltransferase
MFLAMQIKKQGAGVVHSHFGNRGWLNARVARKAKVKHIVSFYGSDLGFLPRRYPEWRFRYKQLFRSVDAVLAEGPHMANLIMQLGCPKEKVMVHHLGVKVDEIGFRPRHKSATEPFSVLIAASFREKKGIVYAVEALKRVNHIHPIIVTIVGNDNGTPQSLKEKEKIMKVINSEENFKIRVRLTGYLGHHELIEEAYKHHVFVSPSVTASDGDIEGGAPVTLIEMAATGIAVVSTRHCDIPGVIQNGKSGFLVDERDVDGLVDCLIWLNDNPGEWGRIANEARSHIEREYNALTQGERLACIYKELAGA